MMRPSMTNGGQDQKRPSRRIDRRPSHVQWRRRPGRVAAAAGTGFAGRPRLAGDYVDGASRAARPGPFPLPIKSGSAASRQRSVAAQDVDRFARPLVGRVAGQIRVASPGAEVGARSMPSLAALRQNLPTMRCG